MNRFTHYNRPDRKDGQKRKAVSNVREDSAEESFILTGILPMGRSLTSVRVLGFVKEQGPSITFTFSSPEKKQNRIVSLNGK